LNKYEPEHKGAADRLLNFREQTGGFNLIRIEKSEFRNLEALVKEREGANFALLKLRLTETDPPKVADFKLNVVPRPTDQPESPRLSFDDTIKALDTEAQKLAAKDRFAGAVLVGRGGKVVFEKAYGSADREKNIANSTDTRFRIGSMNKMFIATAVLQLVGAGKLDLAAPISRYLPDYPNHELATTVTIRWDWRYLYT
jgi:D-alanyl-D-alanine carboxypeptidase